MSYGLFLFSLLRTRHVENVIGTTFGQWLLVCCVFLFLQCAGTVVWIAFGGNEEFSTSWNDSWWISYTLLVDIGTQTGLSARERGSIKFVSAVISLVGFVYFLTLLGMVVDLLRDFLNDMRMRFSSVRASNHWLILGWGDKTLLLIDELLTSIASAPPQRKCCGFCGCRRRRQIVILADMPTQQMADEVQVHCLADPLLQRITTLFLPVVCYKQGNPTDISELLSVSAPNARDILVARTSENGHLSDLKAISALLALAAMPADSPVNGDVWVEVCQEQSLRTVKTILPDSHGIVARKVVNRMMVLRALVPSVGFVFLSMTSASFANKSISGKSQLLTPTLGRSSGGSRTTATLPPAKLHLVPAPASVCGVPFSEVGRFFPDAVVCGVSSAKSSIIPEGNYCLQAQDVLVLVAPHAAAAKRCVVPRPSATSAATVAPEESKGLYLAESLVKSDGQLRLGPAADGPKTVLVLGCPGAGDIAEILDTIDVHVSSVSSVHILSRTPVAEREEWILQHLKMTGRSNFNRITVQQYEGESTNKWDMTKLPLESAHCALILAERLRDDESTLAVDSRNLTSAIFLKQKLDELIQASAGAIPRSASTATNMTVMTTLTDASGPSAAGSRGKKCKMVTELLDAKSETVLDGNAGVRKQGSFMYTNARETAIYALAVEHREVYELFIQLADPYCGIGFVTVAPINHYVTGIEDLSYHQLQRRVWNSCKGVLLGWRDFSKYHPELNPDQKDEVIEWDDMSNLELIILRPPDGAA